MFKSIARRSGTAAKALYTFKEDAVIVYGTSVGWTMRQIVEEMAKRCPVPAGQKPRGVLGARTHKLNKLQWLTDESNFDTVAEWYREMGRGSEVDEQFEKELAEELGFDIEEEEEEEELAEMFAE